MFKPWISDEEPKLPKGWGLATFGGHTSPFRCEGCRELIQFKEQYIYSYPRARPIRTVHNKKECYNKVLLTVIPKETNNDN